MHKSNGGNEFWDKEKENVLNMYLDQKMRTGQIAKIYNCWATTIENHLKRWGIPIRKERYNAKYSIDLTCFDNIDTQEKAYFLGLLLADGHLSKENLIMLTMKDLDIVEKYKKFLKTDCPIKQDRYGNYSLNVKSKHIADALKKIGFHNRKSYNIDFDKVLNFVPDNLLHHFVRGMFDGDGSIKIYHYEYCKNPQYHFGYTGLENIIIWIKQYLRLETKIVKESDLTYTCVTSCKGTIKSIFEKLYKDATVYIDRKYNTFLEII